VPGFGQESTQNQAIFVLFGFTNFLLYQKKLTTKKATSVADPGSGVFF
jgi:hypothetical protein